MVRTSKLPISFDPASLAAELDKLHPDDWVAHFNKGYYEGDWSGAALRSIRGEPGRLFPDPSGNAPYADTALLERCHYYRWALDQFRCPLAAARLLRVGPRSRVREHRDYDLGPDYGVVRVHVPVRTNSEVGFYLENDRLQMEAGEAWYIDFSRPHRVENDGDKERIHLVIDCEVNEWVRQWIAA